MSNEIRRGLWAVILAGFLLGASGAWAWSDETTVQSKSATGSSLLLEDDITVRVSDTTEIRDANGVRIDFSEIPDPVEVAPGMVMVRVKGVLAGRTVQATKIEVRPLMMQ